jgi:catechol 2,3-dioxygenase-like lactoylglutathione lyase family enzyme
MVAVLVEDAERGRSMTDHASTLPTAPRILSSVPTFLVDDVGATARWYAENLGFQLAGAFPAEEPYGYASILRGSAEIMLLRLAGYQKPDLSHLRPEGMWDAYVRTSGVQALHDELVGKPFFRTAVKKQAYGDLEFEVRDPNGYVLVFGGDASP